MVPAPDPDAAATTVLASTDADAAQEYLKAVAVLDEALDVEGKAVNAAAHKLQSLLTRSPTTDGEIEAREASASSVARGMGRALHYFFFSAQLKPLLRFVSCNNSSYPSKVLKLSREQGVV